MADKKISQLTASTTPLVGTEVLAIVQSGGTKKVSVDNLTSGRTVSVNALGIGVSSPTGALDVRGFSYLGSEVDAAFTAFSSGADVYCGNYGRVNYANGDFYITTGAGAGNTPKMKVAAGGDVAVVAGNLVIGTSGKGIEASTGYVNASAYKLAAAGIITESGTSRTLSDADNGKVIYCTSGSAVTISCPDGLDVGFSATIIQAGAGKVTLAASGTATLNSYSGLLSTMGQWAAVSVISPTADVFVASGNLGV